MKTYLVLAIVFISNVVSAQTVGTYHKTVSGKYPHYYKEQAGDTAWSEDDQSQYDQAMSDAIEKLCVQSNEVKRAQAVLAKEKAVGQNTGYVDMTAIHDAGSKLVGLKSEMEPIAKIIKDETGKDASSYPCE